MEDRIQGNLAGIKDILLRELRALYEFTVPRQCLATKELVDKLAALSAQLSREIALYLNRRGQVVAVAIGDHSTVSLPEVRGRIGDDRLSGIRCIHTHPDSGSELSLLDITSLVNLKLDCMAAIEVRNGRPVSIQAAYLNAAEDGLSKDHVITDLDYESLESHPFRAIVDALDRQAGKAFQPVKAERERAILVGLDRSEQDWSVEESLEELAQLALTAGAEIIHSTSQKRSSPDPATFIGRGKAQEIGFAVQELGASCIIIDDELSPAQVRNLEVVTGCKVLDRTSLILDIFAARASTREGKVQVELAQLKHLLPRLTGFGTVLSRLGGGIGTRGPGETKLETDRRHIRRRIADLEKDLEDIKKHRAMQRSARRVMQVPSVALVGYTNAGKSSLLNVLTDAQVLAEDKLFATLDPVTRRLRLPANREVLLSDTVGFVRKLPHHLVAAFRATLEEVVQADLLIHVVDAASMGLEEQIRAVESVLTHLGAIEKPTILAFNKVDAVTENLEGLLRRYPHAVKISARTGEGLSDLTQLIGSLLPANNEIVVIIPFDRGDLIAAIHREGEVKETDYLANGVRLRAIAGPRLTSLIKSYAIE